MSLRERKFLPPSLLANRSKSELYGRAVEFKDTDPHMLFALWDMEQGIDPDESLERMRDADVVFDKFAPRLSSRIR